jgi:hypothetical protein
MKKHMTSSFLIIKKIRRCRRIAWLREKHRGLDLLVFIFDNGKMQTMKPWLIEDIFYYFLEHKLQWKKMYHERELAKDIPP